MLVQMKVRGLMFDPSNNAYIIILRGEENTDVLPIWVGRPEANAISLALEGIFTPRPMTHDLLRNLINTMKAKINHILVSELRDNTFYAVISLVYGGNTVSIDHCVRMCRSLWPKRRSKSPAPKNLTDGLKIYARKTLENMTHDDV